MEIYNQDVLHHIKTLPDKSINLIFSDFPYALGSEWHYVDGRLQLKGQGKDFMHGSKNSWDINNADWWRSFCKEMYRVMKFGGYVAFFSIDRQAFAFQSFMVEAGFEICQTLHWLKISNFPKSSNASKMLDKRLGVERKVVGENKFAKINGKKNNLCYGKASRPNESISQTDLGQTFEGYKYGIAPLKAITEPLLVFRKTPKNGSVLEDLMNLHDSEISPAVLDIEGNRVGIREKEQFCGAKTGKEKIFKTPAYSKSETPLPDGRFPCTMFLNSESAELLDSQLDVISFELNGKLYKEKRKEFEFMIWQHTQNGTLQGCKVLNVEREIQKSSESDYNFDKSFSAENARQVTKIKSGIHHGDSGYLSRVMHTCDFTQDDYDSYVNGLCAYTNDLKDDRFYCPTVSPKERNAGCESLEKKYQPFFAQDKWTLENMSFGNKEPMSNNHPTLKPISLIKAISSLWRLKNGIEQTVYVPFSGTGSEIIGLIQAGYNPNNIIGCEINSEYVEIAKARIAYYQSLQPKPKETKTEKEKINPNTLF